MAIDPQQLMTLTARGEHVAYRPRDAMLYALGVGFGREPGAAGELPFVYEGAGLKVVPTYASALARSGFLKGCGWDETQLVPASEHLTLFRPLSPAGAVILDSDVAAVRDLGRDGGALVVVQMTGRNAVDQQRLFTIHRAIAARGDGGFGGGFGKAPASHQLPPRAADLRCRLEIRPEQGLVYRLSGDANPIHADPAAARRAGLPGPVLQNLCTLGVACRGILETICEFDATLITAFEARFTGGVYPGDRLEMELWQDANIVSFRAAVAARGRTVLDNGRCVLAA